MDNGNTPAMPIFNNEGFVADTYSGALSGDGMGLTKREMFAMAAMQGITASQEIDVILQGQSIPSCAVEMADALLKELESCE